MRRAFLRRQRRGSTILLVLGLLSVLILLSATLAFTTRVEVTSARNFARNVQNRTATITGVSASSTALAKSLPKGPLGPAHLTASPALKSSTEDAVVAVSYQDASARLNLNTATEAQLEALIRRVAQSESLDGINARSIAQAIVAARFGADGRPGSSADDDHSSATNLTASWKRSGVDTDNDLKSAPASTDASTLCTASKESPAVVNYLLKATNDPAEYVVDVRLPAFGDDKRFESVEDLRLVGGVTGPLVEALRPFVTCFSISQERWQSTDGEWEPVLDLNRASANDIADALIRLYGDDKDPDLLRQFAANIVDSRDPDSDPTVLTGEDGVEIIGFERTPLVSEVYPNSLTVDSDGDNGQFVEIYNPWRESISLAGWSIMIGGVAHPLQGTLAPRGYLIVTDDYDNEADPDADRELDRQGSFYDIFGRVANGTTNRVLELSSFNIPHTAGKHSVALQSGARTADVFGYVVPTDLSETTSFQRRNVLVREAFIGAASPFSLAKPDAEGAAMAERLRQLPLNRPYVNVLELFDTFAGFPGSAQSRWGFPAIVSPRSTDPEALALAAEDTLLDARVIDLFTIEINERRDREEIVADRKDRDGDGRIGRAPDAWKGEPVEEDGAAGRTLAWVRWAESPLGLRHGRVNINTAPLEVLAAMGMSEDQLRVINARRGEGTLTAAAAADPQRGVLWRSASDLLVDDALWTTARDRCDRLEAFRGIYDSLTVGSLAFLVEGQGLDSEGGSEIRPAGVRYEGLLAFDQDRPQPVLWRLTR